MGRDSSIHSRSERVAWVAREDEVDRLVGLKLGYALVCSTLGADIGRRIDGTVCARRAGRASENWDSRSSDRNRADEVGVREGPNEARNSADRREVDVLKLVSRSPRGPSYRHRKVEVV